MQFCNLEYWKSLNMIHHGFCLWLNFYYIFFYEFASRNDLSLFNRWKEISFFGMGEKEFYVEIQIQWNEYG